MSTAPTTASLVITSPRLASLREQVKLDLSSENLNKYSVDSLIHSIKVLGDRGKEYEDAGDLTEAYKLYYKAAELFSVVINHTEYQGSQKQKGEVYKTVSALQKTIAETVIAPAHRVSDRLKQIVLRRDTLIMPGTTLPITIPITPPTSYAGSSTPLPGPPPHMSPVPYQEPLSLADRKYMLRMNGLIEQPETPSPNETPLGPSLLTTESHFEEAFPSLSALEASFPVLPSVPAALPTSSSDTVMAPSHRASDHLKQTELRRDIPIIPGSTSKCRKMEMSDCRCGKCTPGTTTDDSPPTLYRTCKLCNESVPSGFFPPKTPTSRCQHEVDVCRGCLQVRIESQALRWPDRDPFCPGKSQRCMETLGEEEIAQWRRDSAKERSAKAFSADQQGHESAVNQVGQTTACLPSNQSEQQEPRPRPSDVILPETICSICMEGLTRDHYSPRTPTLSCSHEINICMGCLVSYIDGKVHSDGVLKITCPSLECAQMLAYEDVKMFADCKTFKRYDDLLLRAKLREEGFVWCKKSGCDFGQYHVDGHQSNIVTCGQCGSKSCFTHDSVWHTGMTCKEYDAANADKARQEELTKQYLKEHTKKCPKCQAPIQKDDGCEHMTCKPPGGCGHQFCWICLAEHRTILREGNQVHRPECRLFSPWPTNQAGRNQTRPAPPVPLPPQVPRPPPAARRPQNSQNTSGNVLDIWPFNRLHGSSTRTVRRQAPVIT